MRVGPSEDLFLCQWAWGYFPKPLDKLTHLPAGYAMNLPAHTLQHDRLSKRHISKFLKHNSKRFLHRFLDFRVNPQPSGDLLPNRFPDVRSFLRLRGQDFGCYLFDSHFRQVASGLHSLPHNFAERRLAVLADDLLAGAGQSKLDFAPHFRGERCVRFIFGVGSCRVLLTRAEGVFDAAMDLPQDDPLLTDFVVCQETAGQQSVAAVVDGEVGERGAAAAGDEKDQLGAVLVLLRIILALETHRPAQKLDDRVERTGHADAVDGGAHRPIRALHHSLDADNRVVTRFRMKSRLFGCQRIQESSLVLRAGARGIEYAGAVRLESMDQPGDQATAAPTHRRHAHDCLGLAVVRPATTYCRYQLIEVGSRRSFFAGELSRGDLIASMAEGDDLAFQVARGESFGHVFGQRTAIQPHAIQGDGTAIAAIRRCREEVKLPAALAPQGDDF